jgi:predicted O-methyltransferase YrrM
VQNLSRCNWSPHPLYSVFTQYDKEFYLENREPFLRKYRCFWAVSRTISPRSIIELGCQSGSSADAYLSATPSARYTGIDLFLVGNHHDTGGEYRPLEIAQRLFAERGFYGCELIECDLRALDRLPRESDMVVVDAAHDFENEYADLLLALTAHPTFIFVDDAAGEDAKPAIDKFLIEIDDRVEYVVPIDYAGGGLVIKLRS